MALHHRSTVYDFGGPMFFLVLVAQAGLGVVALETSPTTYQADMDPTIIIGQIVLFLTTVIGFGIQLYRESRNRRWAEEKEEKQYKREQELREWDLQERKQAREALHQETRAVADRLAVETRAASERLHHELAMNTDVSIGAFKEANDVNKKIFAIAGRFLKDEETSTIEDIDKTTKEINEKVTDLTDALTAEDETDHGS